jgi:uncharacterized protein (TIGR03643 family)
MANIVPPLTSAQVARAIEVAWNDRPPFNVVKRECGLSKAQVVELLKRELKPNEFKAWNARIRTPRGQPSGLGPARG